MKGVTAGIEFVGKILIVVFIIGMIVIIIMSLLPTSVGLFCEQRQYENINSLIHDSVSARSTVVKSFSVEECVEYINFKCENSIGSACYKIKFEGKDEQEVPINIDRNLLEVSGKLDENGELKLKPNEYLVTIDPYSIKFPQQNS